jgi:hypothetical protein
VRAVQAARGARRAAHTRATAEAPAWSAPSVPDFVSEYAGQAGAHQAGEVKVYNTIISDAAQAACSWCDPGLRRDARAAAAGKPRRLRAEGGGGAAQRRRGAHRQVPAGGARGRARRARAHQRGLGPRLLAGGDALPGRAGAGAERRHRHRAREHDVFDVVLHLLHGGTLRILGSGNF